MVGPEALAKLLLGDLSSIVGMSILVRLSPILCYNLELAEHKKHLLMVITLSYVKLSLHSSEPDISF